MSLIGITGCMFNGKTRKASQIAEGVKYSKRRVLYVKPDRDDRWKGNKAKIQTHHGDVNILANTVSCMDDIFALVAKEEPHLLVIDEVPLLGNLGEKDSELDKNGINVVDAVDYLAHYLKLGSRRLEVVVTGLNQYFNGDPFDIMNRLISLSGQIYMPNEARCFECGSPATRTQRFKEGIEVIVKSEKGVTLDFGDEDVFDINSGDVVFSSDLKNKKIVKPGISFSIRLTKPGIDRIGLKIIYEDIRVDVPRFGGEVRERPYNVAPGKLFFGGVPSNYDDPLIEVGGMGKYESACEECHTVPGRPSRLLGEKFLKHRT